MTTKTEKPVVKLDCVLDRSGEMWWGKPFEEFERRLYATTKDAEGTALAYVLAEVIYEKFIKGEPSPLRIETFDAIYEISYSVESAETKEGE